MKGTTADEDTLPGLFRGDSRRHAGRGPAGASPRPGALPHGDAEADAPLRGRLRARHREGDKERHRGDKFRRQDPRTPPAPRAARDRGDRERQPFVRPRPQGVPASLRAAGGGRGSGPRDDARQDPLPRGGGGRLYHRHRGDLRPGGAFGLASRALFPDQRGVRDGVLRPRHPARPGPGNGAAAAGTAGLRPGSADGAHHAHRSPAGPEPGLRLLRAPRGADHRVQLRPGQPG